MAAQSQGDRPAPELVRGTVERKNDKGIRLAGRPEWLNYSQYARMAVADVAEGDDVEVYVSKGKWIEGLKHVGDDTVLQPVASAARRPATRAAAPPLRSGEPEVTGEVADDAFAGLDSDRFGPPPWSGSTASSSQPAAGSRPALAPTLISAPSQPAAVPSPAARSASREPVTTRLSVLDAAARFHAGHEDSTPDQVLETSRLWLAWVEAGGNT